MITGKDYIGFGVHKGKRLMDVPEDYLVWIYGQGKCPGPLRKYIRENIISKKR